MTSPSKSQLIQFYPSATHRQQSLAFDAVDLQGMVTPKVPWPAPVQNDACTIAAHGKWNLSESDQRAGSAGGAA
jgi:hypothetical protein